MRDPRLLAAPGRVGVYHLCSRVVDKRFVIKQREKARFMELMRSGAAFAGVELVTWCVMDNHFHLLVRVPPVDAESLDDEEVLSRLSHLYTDKKCTYLREVWQHCGGEESRRRFLSPFRKRIGNLSDFMKTLKQRFSQWYNHRKDREGTLWEGRFRSVLLQHEEGKEGLGPLVRFVAGYIDLNPVRAKMLTRAADSLWSGFGAAVRGDDLARAGLRILWGERLARRLGDTGLIEHHGRMLASDEPLGVVVRDAAGIPRKKPCGSGAAECAENLRGETLAENQNTLGSLVFGLPPEIKMSRRCAELSRARFLGQPESGLPHAS